MGTLTKTAPPPTRQPATRSDWREQEVSRANFRPFSDSLFTEASLSSATAETQTQLNHATHFGHQFGQVLPALAASPPVQAKALDLRTDTN